MQDRFTKFDGVVTARNAETGDIIFNKLHNTIVINGCLKALSSLSKSNSESDYFYMLKRDESNPQPEFVDKIGNGADSFGITRYNFSYMTKIPQGELIRTVPKNEEASDTPYTENEGILYTPSQLREDTSRFNVENFNGITYKSEDIDDNDSARKAFIFYDEKTYSTFLRLRLRLSNNLDVKPFMQENINPEWSAQDITYINSVMLYLQDRTDKTGEMFLFSRLKFPPIPFFGNLAVDFEYRIYI